MDCRSSTEKSLPHEVWAHIFSFINSVHDVTTLSMVSKEFKKISERICWRRVRSLSIRFGWKRNSKIFSVGERYGLVLHLNNMSCSFKKMKNFRRFLDRRLRSMTNLTKVFLFEDFIRQSIWHFPNYSTFLKLQAKASELIEFMATENLLSRVKEVTVLKTLPYEYSLRKEAFLRLLNPRLHTLSLHVCNPWLAKPLADIQSMLSLSPNLRLFRVFTPHLDLTAPQYETLFIGLSTLACLKAMEVKITTCDEGNFTFVFPQDFRRGTLVKVSWNERSDLLSSFFRNCEDKNKDFEGNLGQRVSQQRFGREVVLEWDCNKWNTIGRITRI